MEMMFLGTGGYHPNDRRETAGLFFPELGLLLDAGTGTYRLPDLLQTDELTICLSHSHLDHVVGLTYLLPPLITGKIKSLKIYGTRKTLHAVQRRLFHKSLFPVPLEAEWLALEDHPEIKQGKVTLRHRKQRRHPGGSVGFRLDQTIRKNAKQKDPKRLLAYITDTAVDPATVEFVRGSEVLVHECYFPDESADWAEQTGHSHTTPVVELARDAQVELLLLTHIDPLRPVDDPVGLKQARKIFQCTELAEDGMCIEFSG